MKQGIRKELKKNKYKYILLITIIIIGIISGFILANILSFNDKKIISSEVGEYLINLKNGNNFGNFNNIINSFSINILYLLIIFIFSLSVIGIIFNPIILYFKSFIVGFSIGIMINIYSFTGILFGIFSVFPHQIVNLVIYLFVSFYGMKLSINLFKLIFLKKKFDFSSFMAKYLKVMLFSVVILIISSIYEVFLGDFILKVFTFLLNSGIIYMKSFW